MVHTPPGTLLSSAAPLFHSWKADAGGLMLCALSHNLSWALVTVSKGLYCPYFAGGEAKAETG